MSSLEREAREIKTRNSLPGTLRTARRPEYKMKILIVEDEQHIARRASVQYRGRRL